MKKEKIVITGAQGFLGTHVAMTLKKDGYAVVVFDKKKHDLLYPESMKDLLHGASTIVHLAGANRDNNIVLCQTNTLGTIGLLDAVATYAPGAKIIFASTFQVFDPQSFYGLTKKCAEDFIMQYAQKKVVKGIIFRIANIYGPGCRPFYNSVIATFAHLIKQNKVLNINGNGKQLRDYIYVSDVVAAIKKAIELPMKQHSYTFDICSGELLSLNDIISSMRNVTAETIKVQYNSNNQEGPAYSKKDYSQAQQILGWKPSVSFQDGIKTVINS